MRASYTRQTGRAVRPVSLHRVEHSTHVRETISQHQPAWSDYIVIIKLFVSACYVIIIVYVIMKHDEPNPFPSPNHPKP